MCWPCVFCCCCVIDFWLVWFHGTVRFFSFDCEMHAFILASGKLSVLLPHRLQLGYCGCSRHSVLDLRLWSTTDKCSTTAVSCSASPGPSLAVPLQQCGENERGYTCTPASIPGLSHGRPVAVTISMTYPPPCFSSLISKYSPSSIVLYVMPHQ